MAFELTDGLWALAAWLVFISLRFPDEKIVPDSDASDDGGLG
jgi:hypothetical protein